MKDTEKKNWVHIVFTYAADCKGKMFLSVIAAIISVAGSIVPYIGVYQIIQLFFNGAQTMEKILGWCIFCAVGHLIKVTFYGISTSMSHISAYTILENMRLAIARKLMKAPLGTVLGETAGKLKSVIVERVETIELPLAHMIPEGLSNLLVPIAVFGYLCSIDWRMALACMVNVPIGILVYGIMMNGFGKKYEEYMAASNHVNSVIVEYVEGIEVIKAFNQSTSSYEKFEQAVRSFRDYTLDWFKGTWKLMNLGGAILPTTLLGTLPIGLYLYIMGSLSPEDYIMCMILALGIVAPVTSFTVFVNDAKAIEFAVQNVKEYLDIEELQDRVERVDISQYDVTFKDVSFSYDSNEDNMVLKDISLQMKEGKFTAIVGPSGGGKSTVAKLIARFWDVTDGQILIGKYDIRQIPLSQLVDIVSFVTQDNFLFRCSIKENIRLGNPKATDKEVLVAAEAACCDEFICRLEQGYDTDAGVAGGKLSGGEKQRIAIARAILKNAPIVILDEATAFTDPENEEKIQQSIQALTKGKTLIVIAHRLSTIKSANQIILLKEGHVQARGTLEELLIQEPIYKSMWEAHVGTKKWAAKNAAGKGEA